MLVSNNINIDMAVQAGIDKRWLQVIMWTRTHPFGTYENLIVRGSIPITAEWHDDLKFHVDS